MKKLMLATVLCLPMISAHADLTAILGGGIGYSEDSTAGHLTSNDLSDIRKINIDNARQTATNFCVREAWKEAAEANIRLDLKEDTTDLIGTNSDQYNHDISFASHRNVEIIIKSCIDAKVKSIINQNK